MNPIIYIFNFNIRSYGLLLAVGTVLCFFVVRKKTEHSFKMNDYDLSNLFVLMMVFGFLLAKVVFSITNHSLKSLYSNGGFSSFGGIIGIFIAAYIYSSRKKINFGLLLDHLSFGIIILCSVGRIGCFLGGCCYGLVTNSWIGIKMLKDNQIRYPTQLFLSFGFLVIYLIVTLISKFKKFNGEIFLWTLTLISLLSFFIEFYRDVPKYFSRNISLTQIILLPIIPCFLILFFYLRGKSKRRNYQASAI
jgi:phosphatidylglycerol:prolipoprotein diacylglycerol transferase